MTEGGREGGGESERLRLQGGGGGRGGRRKGAGGVLDGFRGRFIYDYVVQYSGRVCARACFILFCFRRPAFSAAFSLSLARLALKLCGRERERKSVEQRAL